MLHNAVKLLMRARTDRRSFSTQVIVIAAALGQLYTSDDGIS
jgi:hypothetical protein